MTSDSGQEIFLCPTCGAQNLVGQQSCQACGQTFQYNCPYCGAFVDATLVNCPSCRERLYWPTPQRVKAFPKQTEAYGARGGTEEEEEAKPRKKKSDPWLTGCLGLIIIVVLVGGVYFVYDTLQETPSAVPYPASGNQSRLEPMRTPGFEFPRVVGSITVPEAEPLICGGDALLSRVRQESCPKYAAP